MKKGVVVAIIFLFIGTWTVPSVPSAQTSNIITVDDEPGDADFTSIKEAVDASSPGDSIWVYSGTYYEQGIHIVNDDTTLLGFAQELGDGDDTGKPCISGDGTAFVIHIEANHTSVTNVTLENSYASNLTAHACIMVGLDTIPFYEEFKRENITIEGCMLRNAPRPGIWIGDVGKNIRIIHNEIHNCTIGILSLSVTHRFMARPNITENVITDCSLAGIDIDDTLQNISGNTVQRCRVGVILYPAGVHNMVYGNDFESCPVGVKSMYGKNTIIKNEIRAPPL